MDLMEQTDHRPWPLPEGPWIQEQTWGNILFAHWPVPPEAVRPLVPDKLELDTWEGEAWVGITPICITGLRLRGTPALPLLSTFPEVDVRTYVQLEGKPGVFYFTLEAPNPVVAAAARLVYHMPFVAAEVSQESDGETFHHRSCRTAGETGTVEWEASYHPVSEPFEARPGTREYFLIERWALYTVDGQGNIDRAEIHRLPWPVQRAQAEIRRNTLASACGIPLPHREPLLHFSQGVDVLIWPPAKVR
jgi:uncharacterized protein